MQNTYKSTPPDFRSPKLSMPMEYPSFPSVHPNFSSPQWRAGQARPADGESSSLLQRAEAFVAAQKAMAKEPEYEPMSFGTEGTGILARNAAVHREALRQSRKEFAGLLVVGALAGGPAGTIVAGIAHFATGGWAGEAAMKAMLAIAASGIRIARSAFDAPEQAKPSASTASAPALSSVPALNDSAPPPKTEPSRHAALPITPKSTEHIESQPRVEAKSSEQLRAIPAPLPPGATERRESQARIEAMSAEQRRAIPAPLPPGAKERIESQARIEAMSAEQRRAIPMPPPPGSHGGSQTASTKKSDDNSESYAGQADHSLDISTMPALPLPLDQVLGALARQREAKAPKTLAPNLPKPSLGMDI